MLKIEKKPLAIWHLFAMQVGELTDGLSDINELEEMLFHFSKLLHPNHYILVDIMHNLVSAHQEWTDESTSFIWIYTRRFCLSQGGPYLSVFVVNRYIFMPPRKYCRVPRRSGRSSFV